MQKKIKLSSPLSNYKVGAIVTIQVDKAGIPFSEYWRRRFKEGDGFEFVTDKAPTKDIKEKKEKKETTEYKKETVEDKKTNKGDVS